MLDPNSFYIKVPNDYPLSSAITKEEFTAYVLLCRFLNEAKGFAMFRIVDLMQILHSEPYRKNMVKELSSAIQTLYQKHILLGIYNFNFCQITKFCKSDVLVVETPVILKNYLKIYDWEIDKISDYLQTSNINKYKLIRYYIAIKRVCNFHNGFELQQHSHIGYLTQKQCQNIIENSKCVTQYNNILQQLGLICFNNNWCRSGGRYIKTYFNDTSEQTRLDQYCEMIAMQDGMIPTNKIKSNLKRSITKKNVALDG